VGRRGATHCEKAEGVVGGDAKRRRRDGWRTEGSGARRGAYDGEVGREITRETEWWGR
jgi:hypothetical protein